MAVVIGIDPGMSGGIAEIRDGRLIAVAPLPTTGTPARDGRPYSVADLRGWILGGPVVVIERQQAYPGQGVCATFTTGVGFGALTGIALALGATVRVVGPREWQRDLGVHRLGGEDTKARALEAATALFPGQSWLASSRCRVPHDGMVDAALIAMWGWVTLQRGAADLGSSPVAAKLDPVGAELLARYEALL